MTIRVSGPSVHPDNEVAGCYVSRDDLPAVWITVNIKQAISEKPKLSTDDAVKALAIAIFEMKEMMDKARQHNGIAFNGYE